MSGLVDTYITYRIITTLTKPWKEQDAYEFGIIDDKGKVLRKSRELRTSKEKKSYSILEKIPGGKSKIGSYAIAALVFLKEEDDEELKKLLGEDYGKK